MKRVHIFVEGQTEETFVREILYEHFQRLNIQRGKPTSHVLYPNFLFF